MFEINHNVVVVKGAKNAAIYNFNDSNVYSIDDVGYSIIQNILIKNMPPNNDVEKQYIQELIDKRLTNRAFKTKKYESKSNHTISLGFAWLELTNKCNCMCLHCYEGNYHHSYSNSLTLSNWKSILEQLYEIGCKKIQFTGGEPCLFFDFKELLIHASNLGFEEITVFTNASILTDELIRLFQELNIHVRFSLYAHCQEIHDSITQCLGSFSKTINNVKKMIDLKIDLFPSVIIMKENEMYVKEIKEYIESLGLKYRGYDVIRPTCYGNHSTHMPTDSKVMFSKHKLFANFTTTKEEFDKAFSQNTCWYGKIAIDSTGNVFPCVFHRSTYYGNVLKNSIRDILTSLEVERGWFCDFSKINFCKDCEFRFACKDCRALSIALTNDFFEKNPRCLYNPYKGEWDKTPSTS